MRNLIIFLLVCTLLVGCGSEPSADEIAASVDAQVALAIDETSEAIPKNTVAPTDTPAPTNTPVPTKSPVPDTATPDPTATNTFTSTPTKTPTATSTPTQTATPPYPDGDLVEVVNVVDGDTIDVNIDGVEYRVRYIGMDTPERGAVYFTEATQANADMVEGQTVVLVKDVSETDRYNRLLRYVYLEDGTFVNAELVRQGFAQPATYPPDIAHQDDFVELLQEAREESNGLWGLPTNTPIPLPTSPPPPPTAEPPPPAQNCDPSYPGVCIPPYPPDLDCGEISFRRFQVLQPDPHGFDRDKDGIGCESG